ncbi:MAG: helix-turn-helix transcriptional regulator [Paracoccaceae bacterium]
MKWFARFSARVPVAVAVVLAIQLFCAFFFIFDILSSLVGFRVTPISWQSREYLEIGAALGLVLGIMLGAITLTRALRERNFARESLRRASGVFMDLLNERFSEWGLTPAEADVALFAIKGMSTAEIAVLRVTSEGTVKAQTNAIYRKAGVTGRPQLLSLFIEDLMRDDIGLRQAPATVAAGVVQSSA